MNQKEENIIEERKAESFEHAVTILFPSEKSDIERYRSVFAFRGLSDKNYELKTSLSRLYDEENLGDFEIHLLRNFRKYHEDKKAHQDYSVWQWLTLAQHHGLPTRLLDWTYSPLVALHFVTENIYRKDHRNKNKDGIVWCVDYVKANETLHEELKTSLKTGSSKFTIRMLEELTEDGKASEDDFSKAFKKLKDLKDVPFVIFFEPPSINERIVNQYALFSITSDPVISIDKVLPNKCFKKVIIPNAIKKEIRDKLDLININERILFPGLDGLAKWLTRHFTINKDS